MSEARRVATYDDLLAVPDHLVAEIVAGELYTSPRPAGGHSLASSRLGGELYGPFDRGRGGPGGWWVLDEPELHLGADVLVPDLAGWRKERLASPTDVVAFELPPDWVCEVLSPSTAVLDRARKLPVYGRAGVGHAWLIDPKARTLEVYRREEAGWLLLGTWGDDALVRAEPFGELELDLLALWGEDR